jgi:hypothetical protein
LLNERPHFLPILKKQPPSAFAEEAAASARACNEERQGAEIRIPEAGLACNYGQDFESTTTG